MKRFGLIIFPIFTQSFLLMLPVQATHKEINGCGDDSGLGRFVPNQPVGVDFRPVCDNHDECYGTLGESREHCDKVFRSALRAKCEKTLLRSAGGILGTVVTGGQALTSCYGVAEAYYRSVRERGGTAYSKAQTHAREELASAEQSQVPADPSDRIDPRTAYQKYRLNQVSALDQIGNNFAFSTLPNGDLLAIKKSGTDSGRVEVHILTAKSNYTKYRLNQVSVLDQIGDNFAFSALPNGDLLAIKKSGTDSGRVEVHILTAKSNYTKYRLNQVSALDQIGDNFAFSALPNGDLLAIKKSGTDSGRVEVHILTAR
jgi:hypothetical protein